MRVLVVGHERSATTWIGQVLRATTDAPLRARARRRGKVPASPSVRWRVEARSRSWRPTIRDRPHSCDCGRRRSGRRSTAVCPRPGARFAAAHVRRERRVARGDAIERPATHATLATRRRLRGTAVRRSAVSAPRGEVGARTLDARLDHGTLGSSAVVVCFRHPLDVVASVIEEGTGGRTGGAIRRLLSPEALTIGTDRYGVPLPRWRRSVAVHRVARRPGDVRARPTCVVRIPSFTSSTTSRCASTRSTGSASWSTPSASNGPRTPSDSCSIPTVRATLGDESDRPRTAGPLADSSDTCRCPHRVAGAEPVPDRGPVRTASSATEIRARP